MAKGSPTGGSVLKSYSKQLKRLSGETQAASVAAEDGLMAVEERERHRVARTAAADAELREKYTALKAQ